MNQENIGKFLAELRKDKKLTQEQLAEKLGINNRSISRWENGHCLPDLALLEEISKEFDVSVSEILNARRMTQEELIELRNRINLLIDSDADDRFKRTEELNKSFIPEIEKGYELYIMNRKKKTLFSDVGVKFGLVILTIALIAIFILLFPYIKEFVDKRLDYNAYLELCNVLNSNNIMQTEYVEQDCQLYSINVDEYAFNDITWFDSEEPETERLEDTMYVLRIELRNEEEVIIAVYNFDYSPKIKITYKDRSFLCESVSLFEKEGLIFNEELIQGEE